MTFSDQISRMVIISEDSNLCGRLIPQQFSQTNILVIVSGKRNDVSSSEGYSGSLLA